MFRDNPSFTMSTPVMMSLKTSGRNLFIPFAKTQNIPKSQKRIGGARRSRTDDLMLAKHALYQLSYGPQKVMVGPGRLELPTSRLSGVRSNQLSYGPSKGCSPITRRAVLSLRWHYNPQPQGKSPRAVVMAGKRNEDGGVPPVIFAKTSQ